MKSLKNILDGDRFTDSIHTSVSAEVRRKVFKNVKIKVNVDVGHRVWINVKANIEIWADATLQITDAVRVQTKPDIANMIWLDMEKAIKELS